jgi:hypothetical protein
VVVVGCPAVSNVRDWVSAANSLSFGGRDSRLATKMVEVVLTGAAAVAVGWDADVREVYEAFLRGASLPGRERG